MDNLITITDEEYDRLHKQIFPYEDKWNYNDAVTYFEKHTGLGWHIHDENLHKGTVTLKILDEQKYMLARLKYDI